MISLALACIQFGCVWFREEKQKLDLGVDPTPHPLATSAAYRDTIGAYTYYDGLQPMRVRGYGVVVGLGKDGSRDCPRPIYDRLIKSLYKQHHFSEAFVGVKSITPEELIDAIDTAVVIVQGDIPPGAVAGSRFNVTVSAVPGTQTKSLRGGRLYTSELKVFRSVSETAAIVGQALAEASGPVFLNPFSEGESATHSNPLEGVVIGGGEVVEDRRIRLVLTEPSYPKARQIQNRINAQFPGLQKTADAVSPSFVRLRVPPEFAEDTAHFLSLVRSLYVSRDPKFESARARMLAQELQMPTAPHAQIALALEGLGRAAVPVLDDLYVHRKAYVSFYAAVAGLRLGEHIACDSVVLHAHDPASPYRFQAIQALARASGIGSAAIGLRRLLDDTDPRIRIAAYEGLLARRDSIIATAALDVDNFALDRIPSTAGNLVYVKRSDTRRIALFGSGIRCSPPVFYRSPNGGLTLNAAPGDEFLTALRVAVSTGATSSPMEAPLDLHALITLMGSAAGIDLEGRPRGLGLDYGEVVRAVYHLCRDEAINAEFILEQPGAKALFNRPLATGRPESEL